MSIKLSPITIFPDKQLQGQYCLSPFVNVAISPNGDISLCSCHSWLPTSIGNIFEKSIQSMLASSLAKDIRQTIIDGNYRYCNEKKCAPLSTTSGLNTFDNCPPSVQELIGDSSKFHMPTYITIAGDITCNLSCPSCRNSIIKISNKEKTKYEEMGKLLVKNLLSEPTDLPITILLSTSGELFASAMLLNFLENIEISDFPNLKLSIQTNGLLCEKKWHRLNKLQSAVNHITITADSCRPGVYEQLRRGGTYAELISAMNFLSRKKEEIGAKLHVRMVIQRQNYQEAKEFYNFAKHYNADRVEYVRLQNWATRTPLEHFNEDVFDPKHENYADACSVLTKIKQLPNVWTAGHLP